MHMDIPQPVLIGFFPKITECPEPFRDAGLDEICSVSECISKGPPGWIDAWKHNEWFVFDSEELAWERVPGDRAPYDMYAYKMFPIKFDGDLTPVKVEPTAAGDLTDYEFLGYDMVSRTYSAEFDHSPLSCNYGHQEFRVNKRCLIDDLAYAWGIASEIAASAKQKGDWEPGPYYMVAVYRKLRQKP